MGLNDRFETVGPDVVAEEIDGEVIIVNLANGNYYSLTQSGAVVWEGINQGLSVGQLQNLLSSRYSGEPEIMNQALTDVVEALEGEKLIARLSDAERGTEAGAGPLEDIQPSEREIFLPPVFERFTDMEDLLLLDPVHEAEDDKGWPHAKEHPPVGTDAQQR